jgi:hypothetical protein
MDHAVVAVWVAARELVGRLAARARPGEGGEGVVSAAIAVLIMAFLGLALWIAFKATLSHATANIDKQVSNIGQ